MIQWLLTGLKLNIVEVVPMRLDMPLRMSSTQCTQKILSVMQQRSQTQRSEYEAQKQYNHMFIECSSCRNFSFFEGEMYKGKCNRDSIYEYNIVDGRDCKCRACETCSHPTETDGIFSCFWRSKIGSRFDLQITPECEFYSEKVVQIIFKLNVIIYYNTSCGDLKCQN